MPADPPDGAPGRLYLDLWFAVYPLFSGAGWWALWHVQRTVATHGREVQWAWHGGWGLLVGYLWLLGWMPTVVLASLVAEGIPSTWKRRAWYALLWLAFPVGPVAFWFRTWRRGIESPSRDTAGRGPRHQPPPPGPSWLVTAMLVVLQVYAVGVVLAWTAAAVFGPRDLRHLLPLLGLLGPLAVLGTPLYLLLGRGVGWEAQVRDLILPWRIFGITMPRIIILSVPVYGFRAWRDIRAARLRSSRAGAVSRAQVAWAAVLTAVGIVLWPLVLATFVFVKLPGAG